MERKRYRQTAGTQGLAGFQLQVEGVDNAPWLNPPPKKARLMGPPPKILPRLTPGPRR